MRWNKVARSLLGNIHVHTREALLHYSNQRAAACSTRCYAHGAGQAREVSYFSRLCVVKQRLRQSALVSKWSLRRQEQTQVSLPSTTAMCCYNRVAPHCKHKATTPAHEILPAAIESRHGAASHQIHRCQHAVQLASTASRCDNQRVYKYVEHVHDAWFLSFRRTPTDTHLMMMVIRWIVAVRMIRCRAVPSTVPGVVLAVLVPVAASTVPVLV